MDFIPIQLIWIAPVLIISLFAHVRSISNGMLELLFIVFAIVLLITLLGRKTRSIINKSDERSHNRSAIP